MRRNTNTRRTDRQTLAVTAVTYKTHVLVDKLVFLLLWWNNCNLTGLVTIFPRCFGPVSCISLRKRQLETFRWGGHFFFIKKKERKNKNPNLERDWTNQCHSFTVTELEAFKVPLKHQHQFH